MKPPLSRSPSMVWKSRVQHNNNGGHIVYFPFLAFRCEVGQGPDVTRPMIMSLVEKCLGSNTHNQTFQETYNKELKRCSCDIEIRRLDLIITTLIPHASPQHPKQMSKLCFFFLTLCSFFLFFSLSFLLCSLGFTFSFSSLLFISCTCFLLSFSCFSFFSFLSFSSLFRFSFSLSLSFFRLFNSSPFDFLLKLNCILLGRELRSSIFDRGINIKICFPSRPPPMFTTSNVS